MGRRSSQAKVPPRLKTNSALLHHRLAVPPIQSRDLKSGSRRMPHAANMHGSPFLVPAVCMSDACKTRGDHPERGSTSLTAMMALSEGWHGKGPPLGILSREEGRLLPGHSFFQSPFHGAWGGLPKRTRVNTPAIPLCFALV